MRGSSDFDDLADLTRRYEELCGHYGMTATRNNAGVHLLVVGRAPHRQFLELGALDVDALGIAGV